MESELIKAIAGLGQAAIFAFAAYQFYRDGRAQDKVFIAHLQEQNRMLFAWIQRLTFLRSSAILPDAPNWSGPIPTDIEPEKMGQI